MTIHIKKAFPANVDGKTNRIDYYPGQIVTLSPAEESSLVALDAAEYYDNNSDYYQPYDFVSDSDNNVFGVIGPNNKTVLFRDLRQTPIRVATFGDSTAEYFVPDEFQTSPILALWPAAPAGLNNYTCARHRANLNLFYSQASYVFDGGVGGETTTQALARSAAAPSATRKAIEDLLNYNPDVVLLRCGSPNDLPSITGPGQQVTIDGIYNRHIEIVNRLANSEALVIDCGFFGYSTVGSTNDQRAALVQLNERYEQYIAQSNFPNVRFIRSRGLISGDDGNFFPGMAPDGVHIGNIGADTIAREELKIIRQFFGESMGKRYKGVNKITNPNFASSSTVAIGVQATGYSIGVTNGTRQNAKIEMRNGKFWQSVEIVPTNATATTGSITIPFQPTLLNIAVNDVYGFEVDFFVEGLDGNAPPSENTSSGRIQIFKSGAGRAIFDILGSTNPGLVYAERQEYKLSYPPIQFSESSATLTDVSSSWTVTWGTASGIPFRMGISNPRMIKLLPNASNEVFV